MIILLLKAEQHSLFDAQVPVRGHATKTGTYVQPYQAKRKKRLPEAPAGDLPEPKPVRTNPDDSKKSGWMQAPNGEPTKLNARQWVQVRTPEFKQWFGDWENDPANASKAVDENGEPRVVYHGSHSDIQQFIKEFLGKTTGAASAKKGFFFASKPRITYGYMWPADRSNQFSLLFGNPQGPKLDGVLSGDFLLTQDKLNAEKEKIQSELSLLTKKRGGLFAKTRNKLTKEEELRISVLSDKLKEIDALYVLAYNNPKDSVVGNPEAEELLGAIDERWGWKDSEANIMPVFLNLRNPIINDFQGESFRDVSYADLIDTGNKENNDSAIFNNTYDGPDIGNIYVAFSPTQIKSAIGNVGAFSPTDPNILKSHTIILLLKAEQHSLFDAQVPVKGHATKTGAYVQSYQAKRKKRLPEADVGGAARKMDRQLRDAWKDPPYKEDLFSKPEPKPEPEPVVLAIKREEPKPEAHILTGLARTLAGQDATLGDVVRAFSQVTDKDWQYEQETQRPAMARTYRSAYADARLMAPRLQQIANRNPKLKLLERLHGEPLDRLIQDCATHRYYEPTPDTLRAALDEAGPPPKARAAAQKKAEEKAATQKEERGIDAAYRRAEIATGEAGKVSMRGAMAGQITRTIGTVTYDGVRYRVSLSRNAGYGHVAIGVTAPKEKRLTITAVADDRTLAHGIGALLASLKPEAEFKLDDFTGLEREKRVREAEARERESQRMMNQMRRARKDHGGSDQAQPWDQTDLATFDTLNQLRKLHYKSALTEKSIALNEERLAADPTKFPVGSGVAWKVAGQTNRGFRVIGADLPQKLLRIRSVADTGLTTSGGDGDRISDEWIHAADLRHDKKYDAPPMRKALLMVATPRTARG